MYYHNITVQLTFNKTQQCFLQINEKWYKEQSMDPFDQYGLTLIPAKVSKYMSSKLSNEIIALPNFNSATTEVWEEKSYLIQHFIIPSK